MKKTFQALVFIALFFNYFNPLYSQTTSSHSSPTTTHPTETPSPFPFEDIKEEHNRSNEDHFISDFMNMLASLGLIIALIFIVSWFLKRFMNTRLQQINTTSVIKIIERRALTPKSAIYLLEVNERSLIIAESTNGVTLLNASYFRGEQKFSELVNEENNEKNT